MRRHDKEITDKTIIEEILKFSDICHIGLIDNGIPYIVPLNYAYVDGIIYIHSAPNGRKMDLIRMNNRVSFEIEYLGEVIKKDIACEWTTRYRSVMGIGTISIITEAEAKKNGLDKIMLKYGFKGELNYNPVSLSRMVILELTIENITGKQSSDW